MRRGHGELQGQDPLCFHREGAETKTAPLCGGAGNQKRYDICDAHGQGCQSNEHLAGDEVPVQGSRGKPGKGFPHNLRHLFARVFYSIDKDIAKLSDVLGHSSINTTRLYIISTGIEHRRRMETMRLIL